MVLIYQYLYIIYAIHFLRETMFYEINEIITYINQNKYMYIFSHIFLYVYIFFKINNLMFFFLTRVEGWATTMGNHLSALIDTVTKFKTIKEVRAFSFNKLRFFICQIYIS